MAKYSVENIKNEVERERLSRLQELSEGLRETVSPEQKAIENLIAKTSDQAVRDVLTQRLEELTDRDNVSIDSVLDQVRELGVSEQHVLRLGISKYVSDASYRIVKAEEDAE
jgi:hypothetical protein